MQSALNHLFIAFIKMELQGYPKTHRSLAAPNDSLRWVFTAAYIVVFVERQEMAIFFQNEVWMLRHVAV